MALIVLPPSLLLAVLLLGALTTSVVHSQGCDDCDGVGTMSCDISLGLCICLPGVAGPRCTSCLQGYTGFSAQGCRKECECDLDGSLGTECSAVGGCQCHPRAMGDKCTACSFGYHQLSRGCTPCPPCFNGVSTKFNRATVLYQMLQSQLNFSQTGVLAAINQYRELLQLLLEKATNASMREAGLTSENAVFSEAYSSFKDQVDQLLSNITTAEQEIFELFQRFMDLEDSLADLFRAIDNFVNMQQGFGELLEEAFGVNQNLTALISLLDLVSSLANEESFSLLEIANDLHQRILTVLSEASSSLQLLNDAAALQNSTVALVADVVTTLPALMDLLALGEEALRNANVTIIETAEEASRVLTSVTSDSVDVSNVDARSEDLNEMREELEDIEGSAAELSTLLDDLQVEVSSLNDSVAIILVESERLNSEASLLLQRSGDALTLAVDSTAEGNAVITEAEELLMQIQNRSNSVDALVMGLDEVIRNVELAEELSGLATTETRQVASEVRQLATLLGTAIDLLEEASRSLNDTLRLATQLSTVSSQLQTDSSRLTDEAAALTQDISTIDNEVDETELAISIDRDAIAMVTDTANETLGLAGGVAQRIETTNSIIFNLTRELNATLPLPPGSLQEALGVLMSLEAAYRDNQVLVDGLSDEIRRLQASASELRQSYTTLQQHRDLLQQILGNVVPLNCREQFEAP